MGLSGNVKPGAKCQILSVLSCSNQTLKAAGGLPASFDGVDCCWVTLKIFSLLVRLKIFSKLSGSVDIVA